MFTQSDNIRGRLLYTFNRQLESEIKRFESRDKIEVHTQTSASRISVLMTLILNALRTFTG